MKNVLIALCLLVLPITVSAHHLSPEDLAECARPYTMRGHWVCVSNPNLNSSRIPRRETRDSFYYRERLKRPKDRLRVKEATKPIPFYRAVSSYRSKRLLKQNAYQSSNIDELKATIERIRDAQRRYHDSRKR